MNLATTIGSLALVNCLIPRPMRGRSHSQLKSIPAISRNSPSDRRRHSSTSAFIFVSSKVSECSVIPMKLYPHFLPNDASSASVCSPSYESVEWTWMIPLLTTSRRAPLSKQVPEVIRQFVEERHRIGQREGLVSLPRSIKLRELDGRPEPGREAVREIQVTFLLEQPRNRMVQIAQEPSIRHPDLVGCRGFDATLHGQPVQQVREIHPGIDRELKGAPEPSIHFHQQRLSCSPIQLVLHHGDAVPTQCLEELDGPALQSCVNRDAFAQSAYTAGRRLLSEPAVAEHGDEVPSIKE